MCIKLLTQIVQVFLPASFTEIAQQLGFDRNETRLRLSLKAICMSRNTSPCFFTIALKAQTLGTWRRSSADNDLDIISKNPQNSTASEDGFINCDKMLFHSFHTLPSGSRSLHHAQQSEDKTGPVINYSLTDNLVLMKEQ